MKKLSKATSLVLTVSLLAGLLLPVSALAADKDEPRISAGYVGWDSKNFDLTEEGTTDWIYLGRGGTTLPPSDAPVPQDRKDDGTGAPVDIIEFGYLADTKTWNYFWSSGGTTFSWSDGVNKTKSAGESSYVDMLRGFYGENYVNDNVGWRLRIPAAKEVQTLSFVTGGVWARVAVSVYANGDGTPVYEEEVDAGTSGDGHFWKFTVTVEPEVEVEVVGEIRHTETGPDMITLAGAALSRSDRDPDADYTALLSDQIDLAKAWLGEDISGDVRSALEAELAYAEPALESGNQTKAYTAHHFLSLATADAEATPVEGDYADTYAPEMVGAFGWEGDADAPVAWIDGTYRLRNVRNATVTFGVTDLDPDAIRWSRAEGWLPCLVSEYSKNGLDHRVESFADDVSIEGKRFEAAYSRMTTVNNSEDIKLLPIVSGNLTPLNEEAVTAKVVRPGESVTREYAILADRFGGKYNYPDGSALAKLGGFEEHYEHMAGYWKGKVEQLADIRAVPEAYAVLTDAYKAAFVDMLIAADGKELYTGEGDGEQKVGGEAAVELLATMVQLGYTEDFAAYAETVLKNAADAKQIAWPFALYLQKTGNAYTASDFFPAVKSVVHKIAAADSEQAILGLSAYSYLAGELYEETGDSLYEAERDWADALLDGERSWGLANKGTLDSCLEGYISGGTGACPYVPDQAANTRAILDAFLVEQADGTLIAGQGLTAEFTAPGQTVEIAGFPCAGGLSLGYTLTGNEEGTVSFALAGEPETPVILALSALKDNIAYVSGGCEFDSAAGTVTIPVGITEVVIGMKQAPEAVDKIAAVIEAIEAIGTVSSESEEAIKSARAAYDALTTAQKALVINYGTLTEAEARYEELSRQPSSGGSSSGSSGSGKTKPKKDTEKPKTETVTNKDGSKTTVTTDGKGNVTTTVEYTDGTTSVEVAEKDGTVTNTTTRPDKSQVELVAIPGESSTITAKSDSGKTVARVYIPAELPAAEVFTDIPADYWARKGVDTVTALGLFKGAGYGRFDPDADMTRGMLVTVLHRLSGEIKTDKAVRFDDVGETWYSDAVTWAAENNIVQGNGAGRFLPEEAISREMLITILCRFAGTLGLDTGAEASALEKYSDKDQVSSWAADAMAWAADKGLVVEQNGALAAAQPAPRAEVAAILTGFIGLLSK